MPQPEQWYPDAPELTAVDDGDAFEDLVTLLFAKFLSQPISVYQSAREQLTVGESPQRVEIKRDQPKNESGRYVIELAEKSRREVRDWTPAGIYRADNAITYVVGGPRRPIFVFDKARLRRYFEEFVVRRSENSGEPAWHEFNGTRRSFYLPVADARRLAAFWFEPDPDRRGGWRLVTPPVPRPPGDLLKTVLQEAELDGNEHDDADIPF